MVPNIRPLDPAFSFSKATSSRWTASCTLGSDTWTGSEEEKKLWPCDTLKIQILGSSMYNLVLVQHHRKYYIYIYVYLYMYIYICISIYVYLYMYIYMHVLYRYIYIYNCLIGWWHEILWHIFSHHLCTAGSFADPLKWPPLSWLSALQNCLVGCFIWLIYC